MMATLAFNEFNSLYNFKLMVWINIESITERIMDLIQLISRLTSYFSLALIYWMEKSENQCFLQQSRKGNILHLDKKGASHSEIVLWLNAPYANYIDSKYFILNKIRYCKPPFLLPLMILWIFIYAYFCLVHNI